MRSIFISGLFLAIFPDFFKFLNLLKSRKVFIPDIFNF